MAAAMAAAAAPVTYDPDANFINVYWRQRHPVHVSLWRAFLPTLKDLEAQDAQERGLSVDDAASSSAKESFNRRPSSIGSYSVTSATIAKNKLQLHQNALPGNSSHCTISGWPVVLNPAKSKNANTVIIEKACANTSIELARNTSLAYK